MPQLLMSELVLTHVPLHFVVPPEQSPPPVVVVEPVVVEPVVVEPVVVEVPEVVPGSREPPESWEQLRTNSSPRLNTTNAVSKGRSNRVRRRKRFHMWVV